MRIRAFNAKDFTGMGFAFETDEEAEAFARIIRKEVKVRICKALLGRVSLELLEQFAKYEDEDEEMAWFDENYPVRCGFIIDKMLEVQREVEENKSRIPGAIPTIEALDLSMRSYNGLKRAGLNTVAKVAEFIERDDLSKIRGLYWRNVEEIKEKLWE